MRDHVHMLILIPPKYSMSQVIGYIKGESTIYLTRVYGERSRNFVRQHFWAMGYFVSTVGRDEDMIRQYIKNQEAEDKRLDQLHLWNSQSAVGGSSIWGRVSAPVATLSGSYFKAPPQLCRAYVPQTYHRYRQRRKTGYLAHVGAIS